MTDAQAVRCRKRLEQFLVDLLEPVGRSERRHWGEVYVRSLLLDGERKSIEPLATRLPEGNVQAMQQFIGQSPWEWNPVWERLGKRMTAELEPDPAPPKIAPLKPSGKGRPPTAARYGDQRPTTAQEAARQAKGWRTIRWREGSKGWLESRFWAARVQPSHRYQDGRPPGKQVWLLAEWPESEKAPIKYCLCDLPADYSLRRIVRLVKCRWKIEQDYHQLKEELGLDHYEGRNWQGWHHHVTMVMVAHAFLTLETLRGKKNFWVDPAEDAT